MSGKVILGAQWGDEGKGKFIDIFASEADLVVRSQGGNNAGHTVIVGDNVYKLHLIPSGILYSGTMNVIGSGVVLDPKVILAEMSSHQRAHRSIISLLMSVHMLSCRGTSNRTALKKLPVVQAT